MQGSDFSKVRVGDKIWNYIMQEWFCVINIAPKERYPIKLSDENFFQDSCTIDGRSMNSNKAPIYFWDEIKFEIPPPPKRMVKRKAGFWVLFCEDGRVSSCANDGSANANMWIEQGRLIKHYADIIEVPEE